MAGSWLLCQTEQGRGHREFPDDQQMRTARTVQRDVADNPMEVAGTRRGRRGSRQGEARWWNQRAGPWGTVDTEGTFFVPGVTEAQGSPLSLAASGGGWSDVHFEKAIQGRTWGDREAMSRRRARAGAR